SDESVGRGVFCVQKLVENRLK
ncbi:hypothetical protein pipiens_020425, partial [Culex pipiens pipiens]